MDGRNSSDRSTRYTPNIIRDYLVSFTLHGEALGDESYGLYRLFLDAYSDGP